MSFVINQAEIFNYKTNYEVANVSHLTQPSPKQNRTFSGGEAEERGRGRHTENGFLTDVFVDIFLLIVLTYTCGRERLGK